MMNTQMPVKESIMEKRMVLMLVALAGLLAACGGNGPGTMDVAATETQQAPAATPTDDKTATLMSRVLSLAGMSSETAGSVAVEGVAEDRPENSEPSPAT